MRIDDDEHEGLRVRFFGNSRNANSGDSGGDQEYTFDTDCGQTLRAKSPEMLGGMVSAHQDSCDTCKPGDAEREFLGRITFSNGIFDT